MIDKFARRVAQQVTQSSPWTNVYGLARSFFALSTLLTLLHNPTTLLFKEVSGISGIITCTGGSALSLFCIIPTEYFEMSRWICVLVLVIIISGYRPRWSAIPHWYISFSLFSTARLGDGGDQVAAVVSLLLLPIALTDSRVWVWSRPRASGAELTYIQSFSTVTAISSWWIVRLQIAIIYFHAGTAKMQVSEWANGTAMYYWLNSPYMGSPEPLRSWIQPLLTSSIIGPLTWSVILLELLLAASLFMNTSWRKILLPIAIVFHAGIAVFMGISSFSIAMFGAVLLLLRRPEETFLWPRLSALFSAKANFRPKQLIPLKDDLS